MAFLMSLSRLNLRIAIAVLLTAGFASIVHAQPASYRIATEGTYPPWSFKDSQGNLQGWDVDIATALCEKMKAKCEIVAQDWDGIIPGLVARKFDMIVASMAITEQRRQRVDFSDKYKDTISRFVAKKGTPADVSPTTLKGKTIGVQRGSIQAGYLSQNYKDSEIKFYDTPQAAELDLVAGRVDYIFGNMVTYYVGFMKTPDAANFEFTGPRMKGGLLGDGNGIAVRKGDAALLEKINAALAAIRADGTYDRITAKYFPFKLM
jgi:polar amino acid transport system substrate-binding protein/arginine/ornithine transport system substrate-binding protein